MSVYINKDSEQYFAFNIWSIESAKAIIDAAVQMKRNVILQISTKAFLQVDREELRFFVTTYANKKNIQAYLHLDHCKKIEQIQNAIDLGWDSVMIDASELPLKENIRLTNAVSEIAKEKGVLVEAEIGQICGVEDDLSVQETGVAEIEDIRQFLLGTSVDLLAVAIGTAHGLYHGIPKLHYEILEETAKISDIPLVIHGGTGLTDDMFRVLLMHQNVKKINISTDVKLAYQQGIRRSSQKGYLEEEPFDPLKVTNEINMTIKEMAMKKMQLLRKVE